MNTDLNMKVNVLPVFTYNFLHVNDSFIDVSDINFEKKGDEYYALRDVEDAKDMPLDADCRQVKDGYISITPITKVPFDIKFYNEIKKKVGE